MATYTKQPCDIDTRLVELIPDSNFGGNVLCGSNTAGEVHRFILEFDISDLPDSVPITTAVLKLYYHSYLDVRDPVGLTALIYKLTRTDWVELQATWNVYKTGSSWTSGGGDYVTSDPSGGSDVFPAAYGWMEWDIKAIVEDAIANVNDQVELLVRFAIEDTLPAATFASFYSKDEVVQTTLRPKLVIEYVATYDETGREQVILAVGDKSEAVTRDELSHEQTVLAILDESDVATWSELGKLQTVLAAVGSSDLATFNELEKLQTVLAVAGGNAVRLYEEALEQVILAVMGESEALILNELERLQVILAALGSDDKAFFNEIGTLQTILAAMGESDIAFFDEVGKLQDILVAIGAVDAATFNELGRLQTVIAALGQLDLATFTELGKEQIILTVITGYAVKRRELAAIRNLSAVRNLDTLRVLPRER